MIAARRRGGAAPSQGGRLRVVHFGNDPSASGSGISSVIAGHLAEPPTGVKVSSVSTYQPDGMTFLQRQRPLLRALSHAARRQSDDVAYHLHLSQKGSFFREGLVLLVARGVGTPCVVTLHGSSLLHSGRALRAAMRVVCRLATRVHVLSELHRDLLLGISSRHIDVIPNGVDTAAKQEPLECRKRRVIFGGEVGNRKGADVLLAAWQQLSPAGWTLVLCGPVTADYEEVSRRAERDGIEVAGPLPPSKFRQLLSCSRVAVLPSRAEALPMFLLEAMAAGCAIVATDVGDVARLLEGGAGVVVAPGDVDALVGAFRAVLFDDAAQAVMSRMSLQRVGERYSRESIARQWGALYEDVRRASAEP